MNYVCYKTFVHYEEPTHVDSLGSYTDNPITELCGISSRQLDHSQQIGIAVPQAWYNSLWSYVDLKKDLVPNQLHKRSLQSWLSTNIVYKYGAAWKSL